MAVNSEVFQSHFGELKRTLGVIHMAMMASVVVYGIVVFALQIGWEKEMQGAATPPPQELPVPASVFYGLALAMSALVLLLRSRLPPGDGTNSAHWEKSLEDGMKQTPALRSRIYLMSAPERRVIAFVTYLQTRLIVAWALAESVALVGLVFAVLSHSSEALYPFMIGSLALLAMTSPRLSDRVAAVARL